MMQLIDSDLFDWLYPFLLLLFVGAGYALAFYFYQRRHIGWSASGTESSVIGLFALLLAFTFSSASGSMKDRNQAVHETGNAVANLYRNSQLLEDSLRNATREYIEAFLSAVESLQENPASSAVRQKAEAVNMLFQQRIVETGYGSAAAEKLMSSFNAVNSSFYKMLGSYEQRIPPVIIFLLLFSSLLIGMLVGFMNGFQQSRHYLITLIFLVLVILSVQAIRDLDDPGSGSIRPAFGQFSHLLEYIRSGTGH